MSKPDPIIERLQALANAPRIPEPSPLDGTCTVTLTFTTPGVAKQLEDALAELFELREALVPLVTKFIVDKFPAEQREAMTKLGVSADRADELIREFVRSEAGINAITTEVRKYDDQIHQAIASVIARALRLDREQWNLRREAGGC